jgi:hypothetical protein
MRTLRDKLTYANVISTLCLFMLLGGGAYAATQLPKNSVGAKQIKNNAITGKKIKKGTIDTSKLTPATVTALKGTKGDAGPAGVQGPQGTTNSGAYATVEAGTEPGFVGNHSGFAAVERAQEGIVCLTPAAGTDIAHPVASVDLGNSGAEDNAKLVEPFANGAAKECDPGQLEVWTFELFGEPLLQERSNSVAFTVFVPSLPPTP